MGKSCSPARASAGCARTRARSSKPRATESVFSTAGDDGKLVATGADGSMEILSKTPSKWIDHVALGPDGALAWSIGKTAFARTKKGDRSLDLPSSVGGLAFAPKGLRLAITHYNGATLWFPNADAKPETFAWKGSHLGVRFSADGRFLVTSLQEPALHGWRLADGHHMRMTGYPARVRSMQFTADGEWLATSGANEVILWPFASKDGPTGKEPRVLAQHSTRVSAVACHPKQEVLAAGYADGPSSSCVWKTAPRSSCARATAADQRARPGQRAARRSRSERRTAGRGCWRSRVWTHKRAAID
jgi:WD40 repeat protein